MGITILCGVIFLAVKLAYEWPEKFDHFGARIKTEALEKYEPYLGNQHLLEKGHDAPHRDHRPSAQPRGAARSKHPRVRNRARPGQRRADQSANRIGPISGPCTPRTRSRTIDKKDVEFAGMFLPKHSTYFATYFTITGLHGLHVLGGVLVFTLSLAAGRDEALQAQPRASRQSS